MKPTLLELQEGHKSKPKNVYNKLKLNEDSSGYDENDSDVENRYLTATSANGFHNGK
jgi:hypothetical protein